MIELESVAPPRSNGELVFTAPWQQRAFGLVMAMAESGAIEWPSFRERLIARIAEAEDRPYWESWVLALEDTLATAELVTAHAITDRQGALLANEPVHSHG